MKLRLILTHGDGQRTAIEIEGRMSFTPSMYSPKDVLDALFELEQLVNRAEPVMLADHPAGLRLHIEIEDADPLAAFRPKDG